LHVGGGGGGGARGPPATARTSVGREGRLLPLPAAAAPLGEKLGFGEEGAAAAACPSRGRGRGSGHGVLRPRVACSLCGGCGQYWPARRRQACSGGGGIAGAIGEGNGGRVGEERKRKRLDWPAGPIGPARLDQISVHTKMSNWSHKQIHGNWKKIVKICAPSYSL
jgi:hypothetical protein